MSGSWDIIGVSTTGMTLRFDLELAHLARRMAPSALLVAAAWRRRSAPISCSKSSGRSTSWCSARRGERPLLELVGRIRAGADFGGISGTARRTVEGQLLSIPQRALSRLELRDAIYSTPYEKMPYPAYWDRLESAYRVGGLPTKAAREAQLAEIRSVRLITLNYCPMG